MGAYDGEALEGGEGPLGIFLKEQCGATWIEGVPHEGVVAETEYEEVAWGEGLEDVEGASDLALGLLRERERGGVVEDGDEGEGCVVELGGDDGLRVCEAEGFGGVDAEAVGVDEGVAEDEEEEESGGECGSEEGEKAGVGVGRVFLLVGRLRGSEYPRLHVATSD